MTLEQKYDKLKEILSGYGKLLIAYSGGVDSTFLVRAAFNTLGKEKVSACIAQGPSLPQSQYERAVGLAKEIGVDLITIQADEMADTGYRENLADRCYHCKSHLFEQLKDIAEKQGFDAIACGHNFDDIKDYRPGNQAAADYQIKSPLIDAQLTKQDIRKLSKKLGLPTADMPASPCLASRISYGQEITKEKLKQVEQAEEFLKSLGLTEFRVRHHNEIARIEVEPEDFHRVIEPAAKNKIIEKLKELGFKYITLDLGGFRSGSLNDMLSEEQKNAFRKNKCHKLKE
ncbi:MAG: ATP-dependent sacrificial sulfur transferase LarE [Sedimentisphaerales bacterium]|nr:ATP-dependent sacrificial sulfur transferase LarE [Sedimentisphaerales bacterium]